LGWTDFRLTKYQDIEVVEIVCSTYYSLACLPTADKLRKNAATISGSRVRELLQEHPEWDEGTGGKTGVWDLRLISLPFLLFNLILPWLKVFPFHIYP